MPTLSEAARHVVLPSGIVSTGWPAVRAKCADLGIGFDPWQDGAGRALFAKRESGMFACGIGGAVLSIPRQVGKTFLLGAAAFAVCLLTPGTTVIWTAHRVRTAAETFTAMQAMAKRVRIAPHVKKVWLGSGEEEISFSNGSRILFGARERGFGRGFAGVDVLVFDEAQIMTESVMEDMIPATNTAANPLLLFVGTPPRPRDPSEVFASKRAAALSGEDTDTLYIEFSADTDADLDDRDQWAKANPSFPSRTNTSAILRMRKNMPSVESFKREALGIWDAEALVERVIDPFRWSELVAEPPDTDEVGLAYSVKFSADGKRMALAVAVERDDRSTFVEIVDEASTAVGLDGITAWLAERWRDCRSIVVDGKSGAGVLTEALIDAGVRPSKVKRPTFEEAVTAYAGLLQATVSGTVGHAGQPGLSESVAGTTRRMIGNAGGWGFRPITEDDDEVPVEAAALALWGLSRGRTKQRKRPVTGRATRREAVVL